MPTEKVDKYEIFNAAAELSDAGERSAFLAQACGNDPALEAEIAQLLEHDLRRTASSTARRQVRQPR